jgi:hypothetical protein
MVEIVIQYRFSLEDGSREQFDLHLDGDNLRLLQTYAQPLPDWTRLSHHQCPHCPLKTRRTARCPVAVNLFPLIQRFDRLMSFDHMEVEVLSQERTVQANTTAQEGISSLMGLLIATSDCPHTDFFKPMARFHLPFATKEETLWRAAASYLLVKYFEQGESFDHRHLALDGLTEIYRKVEMLNDAIIERIRSITTRDGAVNALIHLDVFAKYLTPTLDDSMQEIRQLFQPLLTRITGAC